MDGSSTWAFLNPNAASGVAEVYYRHENGVVYAEWLTLPATSRTTRLTPSWMPSGSYGVSVYVQGSWPIAVERSMYGGTTWTVGTAGVGTPVASSTWRFAQGIGGWADTYFLVTNPNGTATTASFTFQTPTGLTFWSTVYVPAQGRATLYANDQCWCTRDGFRTTVTAPQGIVVERAMYWASRGSGAQQLTAGGGAGGEDAVLATAVTLDDGGGGEADGSPPTGTGLAVWGAGGGHAAGRAEGGAGAGHGQRRGTSRWWRPPRRRGPRPPGAG